MKYFCRRIYLTYSKGMNLLKMDIGVYYGNGQLNEITYKSNNSDVLEQFAVRDSSPHQKWNQFYKEEKPW